MPIQFPPSPSVNQEYTYEGKVWAWDGSSWVGVRQATGVQKSNIWAKQNLLIPKRGFGLNSGYNGTTDQRRTKAGTIPILKHYIERDLESFQSFTTTVTPINVDGTNLLLWYAADQETSFVNGNSVSTMANLTVGVGGSNATAFSTGPTYVTNVLNSLPVYRFNNNGCRTTLSYSFTNFTFYVIFKNTTGVDSYERIVDHDYANGFWLGRNSSTANSFGGGVREGSDPYGVFVTAQDGQWNIIGNQRDGTTHNMWNNGDFTNKSSNTVTSTATNSTRVGIGGYADGSGSQQAANIDIAEIVFYQSALSLSNRQTIEGYLAWKWGLSANLPSDHPYKSSAP
jgi:hypothetical protein